MIVPNQTESRRKEIAGYIGRAWNSEDGERLKLRSNPLDELDTLNHYCFGGRANFCDSFRVLVLNDRSEGDETIFSAVQLLGTNSVVAHFDSDEESVRKVRDRAGKMKLANRIIFLTGSFEDFVRAHIESGHPRFDYIRLCGFLNRSEAFEKEFSLVSKLMHERSVLGFSGHAKYGRIPHSQMQSIRKLLCKDDPGVREEVDRLKEYFSFTPSTNWVRLSYDNLPDDIRTTKDVAFAREFLEDDLNPRSILELDKLFESHGLDIAHFSRENRIYYQPWFAQKDAELLELFRKLPKRNTRAISEIAWSKIDEHTFWAYGSDNSKAEPSDPDMVPFFNPFVKQTRDWSEFFANSGKDENPEMIVSLTHEEIYSIPIPWNPITRRMLELIDARRTIGEIAVSIREENPDTCGMEEILDTSGRFLSVCELEDIILLRHKDAPVLPFTAKKLGL